MTSPLLTSTIQACVLSATSNIIAQLIKAYRSNDPFTIDWNPLFRFVLFTILNSPPNFLWQSYLEDRFPSHYEELTPSKSMVSANEKDHNRPVYQIRETHLSIPNTLIKFFLDQTLGATINTVLFSLAMAGFRGASYEEATAAAAREFWPLVKAGWKLWPAVSAFNFAVVKTVEGRSLVGSLAGMAWGIFLSLSKS